MRDVARVRIRRVRFKSGGEVHLLPDHRDVTREKIERELREILDMFDADSPIVGYAFVAWDAVNRNASCQWTGENSRIPNILVGDFARARLLAEQVSNETLQDLNGSNGPDADDDPAA